LQAAAGRETAKVNRNEAEALDHALDEIGRLWVIPGDEDDAAATIMGPSLKWAVTIELNAFTTREPEAGICGDRSARLEGGAPII
jgi:hypothetical protein